MDVQPVLDLIAVAARSHELVLVGVGGRGAAGKSTLAALVPGAQVVPTDAFWDGEGFDLSRLRADVLEPLSRGERARYVGVDWATKQTGPERVVEPHGVVVVDGVCALHRTFRDLYHVRVWVEAPRELRLARAVVRDGESARDEWEYRWMPSEDRYVERDAPIEAADVVVDNGGGAVPSG